MEFDIQSTIIFWTNEKRRMPEKTRLLKKLFSEYLQTHGKLNSPFEMKRIDESEAANIHHSDVDHSELFLNSGLLIIGLTCIALIIKLIVWGHE